MKSQWNNLIWRQMHFIRPFDAETVQEMMTHLAATTPRGFVALEVRSDGGVVRHLLGAEERYIDKVAGILETHGIVQFSETSEREPVSQAWRLQVTRSILSLNTEAMEAVTASALAALTSSTGECRERAVLQILLGASHPPVSLPKELSDPHASPWQIVTGKIPPLSAEARKSAREKSGQYTFDALVRAGGAWGAVNRLYGALRALASPGVGIGMERDSADRLNRATLPWRLPLRLSAGELGCLLLPPVGEEDYGGAVAGVHPRRPALPDWYREPHYDAEDRTFASSVTFNPADGKKLSISPDDSKYHCHILGGTGVGKSTLILNLVLKDIHAGKSVIVLDPKSDLITDIIQRIPDERLEDVVLIDAASTCPVGFNPLAIGCGKDAEQVADTVLSVLKDIFADSWGVYSEDILTSALLTLARIPDATLLYLVPLLTDDGFRHGIVRQVADDPHLSTFWQRFNAMKEGERKMEVMPVLRKLQTFTARRGLRNVLGQSQPKFRFMDLFYQRKIVLVPLNKGYGAENARLLGSLLIGTVWLMTLRRAGIAPEKRHTVCLYVDELQDYIGSIATDFSDTLAQARSLGLAVTSANQYRSQLPAGVKFGLDANARNKVCFTLDAADAKEMAAQAPGLTAEDFMALPQYHIYARMMHGGRGTGWVMGKTLPPSEPLRSAEEVRRISGERYGTPVAEVEREIGRLLSGSGQITDVEAQDVSIGRRRKK